MTTEFDTIVIGGGSGGLSYARNAARLGARVALVERDRLGGTCVNRGCVPKKMLWTVARTLHDLTALRGCGIMTGAADPDLNTLATLRRAKIDEIVASYGQTLDDAGVTHVTGDAVLDGPGRVRVDGRTLHAPTVVLAVGGRPARPDFDGADLCDVSDGALGWTRVPRRLAIVGAGYIGCEFAAIYAAFGAEVTLISDSGAVLTEFSEGLQRVAADNLSAQGVTLRLDCKPTRAQADGDALRLTLDDGREVVADRVLLATGRQVNLDVLGTLKDAVALDKSGHIKVDDRFATSQDGLYAIGDCADRLPLTPVAVDDGRVLAEQRFGQGATPVDLDLVATAAFLIPPVAETGKRDTLSKGETSTPLKDAVMQAAGCEFWAYGTENGRLSAVSLVGDGVAEAIGLAAQMIASPHGIDRFSNALPVHPTMTESWLTAPYSH